MFKRIVVVLLVAAATFYGLWRLGFIDQGRVKDEVGELRERAEKEARRVADEAAKRAREAVPGK